MSLSVGIVGLPNSGKSTLFNALLKKQIAQVGEYPYTTIEPNVGVVEIEDERLDKISKAVKISKKVPAAVEFIDIAGLIRGAHKGEGLGNQFLAKIREVDAICHVVRVFESEEVEHVHGKIDPVFDIKAIDEELKFGGIGKPTIYVLNVAESEISGQSTAYGLQQKIKSVVGSQSTVVLLSAKLEAELSELSGEEQKQYLNELGIEKTSLDVVIKGSYKLLDLVTFFTITGGKQVQAWPINTQSKMIEAAGIVHSDFEKGFIAAETCNWQKLIDCGSWQEAKAKGQVKTSGREEVINDGLVVEFKFSV